MAGFTTWVVICEASVPAGGFVVGGIDCGVGYTAYRVPAYLPETAAALVLDEVVRPFDVAEGAMYFSVGFGIVLMFWLLGQVLSNIVAPFWRR